MARVPHLRAADGGRLRSRRRRRLAWVFAVIFGAGTSAGPAAAREVPFAEPPAISTAADGARSVFTADLDGDGDLDVLSASSGDDTIAWYENDGAGGGWTLHTISTTAVSARAVFAADVDGDGDLDALSASASDNTIAWYENDGTGGGWTHRTISTAAYGAASVFAADVDGDGHVDVLSASFNDNTIAWYENDGTPGDGGWIPRDVSTSASFATSVFAADVDGDGDLDVLSASVFDNTIAWYENDGTPGDGGWDPHVISSSAFSASSVFAADIDGDGHVDVLSASEFDDKVAWYENDGSGGGWTLHTISTAADGAQSVFAADVDGDGDLDALSASAGDDTIAWYENDGSGGGWTSHGISTTADSARSVFAADVDGDGDVDVLSASVADDKIAWYRNDTIHRSAVLPGESLVSTTVDGVFSVIAADVDGDGDLDALSASQYDQTIAWHENDGSGGTWTLHTISTIPTDGSAPVSVFAADVDGDGDLDVLSVSRRDDTIGWYENDGAGGGWTFHTITTTNYRAESVIAADVDGDGDLDALSISRFDLRAWYENDGAGGGWTHHAISTTPLSTESVIAADMDGDGDLDALYASSFHETVDWYENDGSGGGWTLHSITTSLRFPDFVIAADVDGDGDVDAVTVADEIAWHENDGSGGGWAPHTISTAAGAASVFAADVDGDGDVDVLSASLNDNMIAWYENDGAGDDWTQHTISTTADGAFSVFAADVDGDGDLDALSASFRDGKIAWYENRGGQLALPTTDVAQKVVGSSEVHDLLAVQVIHRGRAGDADVELASLELLLTDGAGVPLTTGEAQALIQELRVYADDGSGSFEEVAGPPLAMETNLSLSGGIQTIDLPDGDPAVRVAHGVPKTFFVVAEMTADADQQTPSAFAAEHSTESSSTGEDADHDIPLILEHTPDVGTGRVDTALTSASCQAPFDLDLANRTVDEILVCEAGTVIRAGTSFVVVAPGNLTFRAGQGVELATGFQIQSGAFTAEIDPGLEP